MEDIDNGTTNNTDNGTVKETTTKSLDVGEDSGKSLDVGESTNKEIEEGEDPHKNLPTHDHETKKINESDHETKANDEAYEEPKEEVKADLFNLDYFDKPEEAPKEVQEKASELINGDLNYFDNWITEAEDQKKQNKEQLDAYLKSNVESGNQLAYTQDDLNTAQQGVLDAFQSLRSSISAGSPLRELIPNAAVNAGSSLDSSLSETFSSALSPVNERYILDPDFAYMSSPSDALNPIDSRVKSAIREDLSNNVYGNSTSKDEVLQTIREQHPTLAANISDEMLNTWADNVVTRNTEKQIREDMGRNGATVNSGISKAEELNLMNRAAENYNSLSDAEKEMVGKVVDYTASHPNFYNQPLNPLEPVNSRNNRAIQERNQRMSQSIEAARTARETERREAAERAERTRTTPTRTTPSTITSSSGDVRTAPTRTTPSTETPSTSTDTTTTSETTEDTETPTSTESETPATTTETTEEPSTTEPETEVVPEESTETSSDEDAIAKADEAKAAYEEAKKREYEAIHREADETEIVQLAAEVERLRQEWEEAEAEAAPLRPREDGSETEGETKEPRTGHGREDRELDREETLPEWVGGDDPHTSSAGAYWAGAFGDENWSDKVPPKTVQGLIDYANDHHDNPFAMFGMTALMEAGGYDFLKAGKDVQEIIASAKDVTANVSNAMDFFKNGSVLDGIKSILSAGWSVLKVFGNTVSAAWNVCKSTFSFLRSVFAPISSAVSSFLNTVNGYNSVKAMIRDMFGVENTDEVIAEVFGDESEKNIEQKPVNVLNKTGFSVKGGTVTDESDYNRGMKEKENEIASDVCKKTMLYFPYLRKSFR